MMPKGGAQSRGEQLAVLKAITPWPAGRPRDRRAVARCCRGDDARCLAAGERSRDAPAVGARHRAERGAGGSAVASGNGLRSGVARGARRQRLSPACCRISPACSSGCARRRRRKPSGWGCPLTMRCSTSTNPTDGPRTSTCCSPILRSFLPEFLPQVLERQAREPEPAEPAGPFPVEAQRAAALRLMEALGFDFHHGRLDVSLHPFCGGTPDDVRITTRYDEADFRSALMGVLHETGHALYERGLPAAWRGQPVGEARGMVLHESQSLLIEMQVCRSQAVPRFRGTAVAGGFRRRRAGLGGRQPLPPLHPRPARASSASMPTRSPIRPTSSCATSWSGR